MVSIKKMASALVVSALTVSMSLSSSVFAHITIKPEQAPASSFQTFTVSVPNERDTATTTVKLLVPNGLEHVTPTQKPGWEIDVEKEGTGDDATTKSITWSGGQISYGFRDDFTFSAKTPAETNDVQWKTYQTYEGGTVVAWDQDENSTEEDENKGPASITQITPAEKDGHGGSSTHDESSSNGSAALAVAGIAVVMSAVALFLSQRKKA